MASLQTGFSVPLISTYSPPRSLPMQILFESFFVSRDVLVDFSVTLLRNMGVCLLRKQKLERFERIIRKKNNKKLRLTCLLQSCFELCATLQVTTCPRQSLHSTLWYNTDTVYSAKWQIHTLNSSWLQFTRDQESVDLTSRFPNG